MEDNIRLFRLMNAIQKSIVEQLNYNLYVYYDSCVNLSTVIFLFLNCCFLIYKTGTLTITNQSIILQYNQTLVNEILIIPQY